MTPAEAIALNSTGTAIFLAEVTVGNRYNYFAPETGQGNVVNNSSVQVTDNFGNDVVTNLAGGSYAYTPDTTPNLTSVEANGIALTARTSIANVANLGGWYNDGTYTYVNPVQDLVEAGVLTAGQSFDFYDNLNNSVQAFYTLYFCNQGLPDSMPVIFNGVQYLPRIVALPQLSTKLEKKFSSVAEISGGNLILNNEDKYLDTYREMQWDAGTTTILFGWNFNGYTMPYADYQQVANFINSARTYDEAQFTLMMLDNKNRLKVKVPFTYYAIQPPTNPIPGYTYIIYPRMESKANGKPVPLAYGQNYGATPICIDTVDKIFQIASHPCFSLDAVRIYDSSTNLWNESTPQGINQVQTITPNGAPTTGVLQLYIFAEYVQFNWDDNAAAIQIAFDNVFGAGTSIITGGPISSGSLINIQWTGYYAAQNWPLMQITNNTFTGGTYEGLTITITEIGMSLTEALNNPTGAIFSLGSDWTYNQQVSVDFKGKMCNSSTIGVQMGNLEAGAFMTNAADQVADLLTLIGEGPSINVSSFETAWNLLDMGSNSSLGSANNRLTVLKPCLNINAPTTVIDTINLIDAFVASFVYVNANGDWYFEVFDPQSRTNLAAYDDHSLDNWTDQTEQILGISSVNAPYATRYTDGWAQYLTYGIPPNKFIHKQPENTDTESDLPSSDPTDANLWAMRKLLFEGATSRIFQGTIVRPDGLLTRPGDQIHVYWGCTFNSEGVVISAQFDKVMDVIQVGFNFESDGNGDTATTTVYCSNLRGWDDMPGYWTSDTPTFPAAFSGLTGYGTGSADPWNPSWHPILKAYARQSFGYWTDDFNCAYTGDPASVLGSCLV